MAGVADLMNRAIDANDTETEKIARDSGERRNVVGDGTFIENAITIVRLVRGPRDQVRCWQMSRGHRFDGHAIINIDFTIHPTPPWIFCAASHGF